ncbi:dephospho-CoA kinase/protein folding accessory domain-containing protein [compost metagenome]
MQQKEVIIEEYNNNWPDMFSELKVVLQNQLEDLAMAVEHVGSTSVPGLAAKPIIDIDVVIDSMDLLPKVIYELNILGYYHEGNKGIENREAFARKNNNVPYSKDRTEKPEHHLYVCNKESNELIRHIKFRNILRMHPTVLDEYARLKKDLAQRYRNNREAYTDGKTSFVEEVLRKYKRE